MLTLVSQNWLGLPCFPTGIVWVCDTRPEYQKEFTEKAKLLMAKRIEYPSKLSSRWIFHNHVGHEMNLDKLG